MAMSRRAFVIMTAGTAAAACTGCVTSAGSVTPTGYGEPVDIGTVADYPHDGVYDNFSRHRFFVLKRAGHISALSAICPHRRCAVREESGKGFVCPCHGARFDLAGQVIRGPATSNLLQLQVTEAANGHLMVHPE
jgi:Rieske Fe-S protein